MSSKQDEDFGTRLNTIIDHSFLTLSIALGNELGLFKHLANGTKENGMSSTMIANSLNLKERYVREWLGAVYTGGIIDGCTQEGMYYVCPEKAKYLFSGPCLWADLGAMCGVAYNDIAEAFKTDGPDGVPYSRYPKFHGWREKLTQLDFPVFIEKSLIPACDDVWSAARSEGGISVCEIGCSEGVLTAMLAKQFPHSRFWASDICPDAISNANKMKTEQHLSNVTYEVQDASALPGEWSEKFDLVVVYDVIHDLGRPDLGAKEICRVLKPGGRAIIVDIKCHTKIEDNGPPASCIYTVSLFHCMPVSLNDPGGWGLGAAWGVERAQQLFLESGFKSVELKTGNEQQAVYLCTK